MLPYEGAHDDTAPHLTIGLAPYGTHEQLRDAELAVSRSLPIETTIGFVDYGVVSDSLSSWGIHHRLRLG